MSTDAGDARAERIAQGKDELKKWNWGAFLWSWIWALGHKQWAKAAIAFLVSLIIPIAANVYFGIRGNEIAWETGDYASKEELREKQRTWVKAWFIIVGAVVVITVLVVALTA